MLDIGFTELLLVCVIALIVLGPERLPQAVKTMAYWFGKTQRSLQSLKEELEREIGTDEIKRQIHNEAVMKELSKSKNYMMNTLTPEEQGATPKQEKDKL